MKDAGIQTTPIPIKGETRESLVVNEVATGKQYRFVMPGPALSTTEISAVKKALNELVDTTYLIVSGSLPPGVLPEFIGELAEQAKARNIKLIVDTSGDALKYAFEKGVFLLKPNLSELCALAGKKYLAVNEIEAVATQLIRKSACEILVVSMGPEGALLVTKEGAKRFYVPPVKKISTVGAGDSMVAGIVWMLEQNEPVEKAVPFGIACGTAATVYTGPGLFQKSDVLHLLQSVTNEAPVPY
jgi:6-phosphofructokinase 2